MTWAELVRLLADLRDEGTAVVMVTHDEALVEAMADRTLPLAASAQGPILHDHERSQRNRHDPS